LGKFGWFFQNLNRKRLTERDEASEGGDEGEPEDPGVSGLEPGEWFEGEVAVDHEDSCSELCCYDGVYFFDEVLSGSAAKWWFVSFLIHEYNLNDYTYASKFDKLTYYQILIIETILINSYQNICSLHFLTIYVYKGLFLSLRVYELLQKNKFIIIILMSQQNKSK